MVDKTDDEQVEDLKRWWEKNGKFVIILLITVVASVVGGRAWQDFQSSKNETASAVFDQVLDSMRAEKPDELAQSAGDLISKHADTQYAVMAALALAKNEVEKGELESAQQRLSWALENAESEDLKHVVRIRLARLQVGMGQHDASLKLVASVVDKHAFDALYAIVSGDAHFAGGNSTAAIESYQQAVKDTALAPQLRSAVQMKLDDLGAGEAN